MNLIIVDRDHYESRKTSTPPYAHTPTNIKQDPFLGWQRCNSLYCAIEQVLPSCYH